MRYALAVVMASTTDGLRESSHVHKAMRESVWHALLFVHEGVGQERTRQRADRGTISHVVMRCIGSDLVSGGERSGRARCVA
jgi:hypothetical protein